MTTVTFSFEGFQNTLQTIKLWYFFTLQYLLQKMLLDAEFAEQMSMNMPGNMTAGSVVSVPSESMRFAMCVLAGGPTMLVFPFFQKYFVKGLTVGAVKG